MDSAPSPLVKKPAKGVLVRVNCLLKPHPALQRPGLSLAIFVDLNVLNGLIHSLFDYKVRDFIIPLSFNQKVANNTEQESAPSPLWLPITYLSIAPEEQILHGSGKRLYLTAPPTFVSLGSCYPVTGTPQ